MAAAGRAKAAADDARKAADAAAAAAGKAADYARTAMLDMDKAMSQSTEAGKQRDRAAAAAGRAKTAADDAAAQAARHKDAKEHSDAAMASANAAKTSADAASASATAAARSLATARSLDADRKATAGHAAAAGGYAALAMQEAAAAAAAAKAAKAQVAIAKEAKTGKDAEDAKTAATKARDDATKASEAADDAAKKAEAIESDAPAVTAEQKDARNQATAASESLAMAEAYLDHTEGYADARMASDRAAAGKVDLGKHADYRKIVKWIDKTTTSDAALDGAAKDVRNAAERMQLSTNTDVIASRQGNIASALVMVEKERNKAADDLANAIKAYDAAKPFSENGMGITGSNLASGNTLRHTSGSLVLDNSDVRVFAAWQEITSIGQHDLILGNMQLHSTIVYVPVLGVVSVGDMFNPAGGAANRASYQVMHYDRWRTASGSSTAANTANWANTAKTYDYVSYGLWARTLTRDSAAFELDANNRDNRNNQIGKFIGEKNAFVFADPSSLTKEMPNTGTASYTGDHVSHVVVDRGCKRAPCGGNSQIVATIPFQPNPSGVANEPNRGTLVQGGAVARIDFAANTATLEMDRGYPNSAFQGQGVLFYDVEGIKLSGNVLSGGTYRGRKHPDGSSRLGRLPSNFQTSFHTYVDPLFHTNPTYNPGNNDLLQAAIKASTLKLHGGVFGDKAQEIAGTVNVEWRRANPAAGAEYVRDARISIHTAFALRNDEFRAP